MPRNDLGNPKGYSVGAGGSHGYGGDAAHGWANDKSSENDSQVYQDIPLATKGARVSIEFRGIFPSGMGLIVSRFLIGGELWDLLPPPIRRDGDVYILSCIG